MDINLMMKKAQEVQNKMRQVQDKMGEELFTGEAGAGAVIAKISGKGNLKKVKIDEKFALENDASIVADLLIAAINNAKKTADSASDEAISKVMQDLGLPPMFKNMFG